MMMKKPEISVIVTNFNHAKYIKQAVDSVLNQTFEDIEIIIVDDCSTDESRDIITDIAAAEKELIHEPIFLPKNSGKWFALNTGIAKARAKLIALQDADDSSSSDRLERQHHVLKKMNSFHNLCGFKHCHTQEDMNAASKERYISPEYDTIDHEEVTKLVLQGRKTPGINHYYMGNYEVHGASTLFYKQLWEYGMKFLPGDMGLRCQRAEDSDHNTKMTLLLQKTSVLKEPLYCYRRGTSTNKAWLENL